MEGVVIGGMGAASPRGSSCSHYYGDDDARSATALSGDSSSGMGSTAGDACDIEITHEEGHNSDAGGGGAYLEVRYDARSVRYRSVIMLEIRQ